MASKQHGGLGKGLGALLKDTKLTPARDKVQEIPIGEVQANRYQPRQEFDESALDELKESVQRIGVSNKQAVLMQLDQLNINESTVFPYIESSAKYIASKFRFKEA